MHHHQPLSEPGARAQARAWLERQHTDATNLRRVARGIVADLQHQLSGARQRAAVRGTNAS